MTRTYTRKQAKAIAKSLVEEDLRKSSNLKISDRHFKTYLWGYKKGHLIGRVFFVVLIILIIKYIYWMFSSSGPVTHLSFWSVLLSALIAGPIGYILGKKSK